MSRWDEFSERERTLIAFGLTASMVLSAMHTEDETREERQKTAQAMLESTTLMNEITASMQIREIDPEMIAMLHRVAATGSAQ